MDELYWPHAYVFFSEKIDPMHAYAALVKSAVHCIYISIGAYAKKKKKLRW
jgi:hypothetical protein